MTWTVNDLGFLPGGTFSLALAASSDGRVIVGAADTGDDPGNGHAFIWTAAGGMVDLGVLPGGTVSIAYAVSADGTVVVGNSDGGDSADGNTEAFMWTSGGGMVGLGFLGTGTGSSAFGLSPDGLTIVGTSTIVPGSVLDLPSYPFSWTTGGGLVNLGLFSANPDGIGQGASTSGAKIVGGGNTPTDLPWQSISGSLSAVPLSTGETAGAALAITPDGNSIVGSSVTTAGDNLHAFLWTTGGGASLLGFLFGGDISDATAISADGNIVVGFSNWTTNGFNQGFVWTLLTGMVALPSVNIGAPGGSANGISADGSTIVGASRGNEEEPAQHAVYWTEVIPPSNPVVPNGTTLPGWRGLSGINWHGMALVGDKFSNVIGLSDFNVFQEYTNGMELLITSPPVHSDRKRIFVPRFEIEVEAGLGLPNDPAAKPFMVLEVSRDGGQTFLPLQKARSMGAVGQYLTRLRWLNLGNARQWVFRLRYSDTARPTLIGAYIDNYAGLG